MRVPTPSQSHLVTAFDSKSSTYLPERDMYTPFADAMNQALECLSEIRLDGLPEFKTPIVFVPCDKNVSSDRDSPGTQFKPDLAIMTLKDACELHGLDEPGAPTVSEFVSKIPEGSPVGSVGWKVILSAVEMKRRRDQPGDTPLGVSKSQGAQDVDRQLDEEPDTSQPTTCKIVAFPCGHPLT